MVYIVIHLNEKRQTDDAQKSLVNWSSTDVPMDVPEKQKRRTNQRVPAKDPLKVKLVIEESPRTQECKS